METRPITLNTLLISAAAVIGIEWIARIVIAQSTLPPMVGLGAARIFQITLLVMIARIREKSLTCIGISRLNILDGLKKGLIWSLCFGIATGLVFGILMLLGVNVVRIFQFSEPIGNNTFVLFFCVGVVIGPIAEEIFFRGLVYGFFRQWGVTIALIVSTVLFVLPHLAGNSIPLTQVVGGLLFAIAYEVEKNLIVPISIHCLGNLAIFSVSLIAQI